MFFFYIKKCLDYTPMGYLKQGSMVLQNLFMDRLIILFFSQHSSCECRALGELYDMKNLRAFLPLPWFSIFCYKLAIAVSANQKGQRMIRCPLLVCHFILHVASCYFAEIALDTKILEPTISTVAPVW